MRAVLLAVVAVSALAVRAAAAAPPTTVAVDLTRLDGMAATETTAIEQALIARLVQEGFTVAPLASDPAIVIAITAGGSELVLTATAAASGFSRSRTIAARAEPGSQHRLELVQRAVELVRLAAESIPPVAASPPPPPAPAADVRATIEAPLRAPPRWSAGIDAGMLRRRGGADLELAARARVGLWRGLGATAMVAGCPSSGDRIDVLELAALVGPSYELALAPRVALEVTVAAGVRYHRYDATTPVEPTGGRFDPRLAAPVRLAFRPMRALELAAWVAISLAPAREHRAGADVLWRRDAFGVGAGAGVAARF